jgi:predicted unusual protein kinase regulating ubiquinone biosynthesis (AarF/ABC1/UbiB family)
MSRLKATENSNEWINWIEDAISKKLIKYYEYEYFRNFKEIGSGSFGKVYRASWKSHRHLALKSFSNNAIKEIVHEVIINNIFSSL